VVEFTLTGPQLAAAATALARFRAEENKSDLNHFVIVVRESAELFEIIFGPERVDIRDPATGERVIMRGGSNVYGRIVHYFVSKESGEIVRRQLAR